MHLLSTQDMTLADIERIFNKALVKEKEHFRPKIRNSAKKILANLFYEPSTRTSSSFFSAATKLGHTVLQINEVKYSSVTKGETLEDTIRTISQYADAIVLRHPDIGAARTAANVSDVPIINAGDGAGEHPTQTLLDLYTIWKKCRKQGKDINGLSITLMGDLKNGRTIHSLLNILRLYNVKITLVSPDNLRLPESVYRDSTNFNEGRRIAEEPTLTEKICQDTDVLYVKRVQKERGSVAEYQLTNEQVKHFKNDMMVMHPLPRNEEIPQWFDNDRRAYYFEQIKNGLYIRMAILEDIFL